MLLGFLAVHFTKKVVVRVPVLGRIITPVLGKYSFCVRLHRSLLLPGLSLLPPASAADSACLLCQTCSPRCWWAQLSALR